MNGTRDAFTGTERPRLRFAPSPTGQLHIGSAASALLNHTLARQWGGVFLIRIEDTDLGRCREAFVDSILDDLGWLGLTSDEPVVRQSRHFERYAHSLDALRQRGLVYPCFATRSVIAAAVAGKPHHPRDPDGAPIYPGLHKHLTASEAAARQLAGEPVAWRLDMAAALAQLNQILGDQPLTYRALQPDRSIVNLTCTPERWGDLIIGRKDTPTSYHLSVVVDDAYQAISHVVRGRDLQAATDIHRLMQVLLDLPDPVYLHHELIFDPDGRKLSKSARDTSIADLRAAGATPEDIYSRVREILIWADQK
ncbi:MAG: tRNA glutamyl-Q(34) synthetase GluQRS [Hyphomicrobiaceae bacterium]|nr:tRNA glutamyl-Q(34) synthetase GluQRS [Hyphomicrobiaceae bacterium]